MVARVQVGALRHRVDICRWQEFPSRSHAGTTSHYRRVARVWACKQAVDGVAYREGLQVGDNITHTFTLRHRPDITTTHVLEHDGTRYRVVRALDMDGTRKYLRLEATEEGPVSDEKLSRRTG